MSKHPTSATDSVARIRGKLTLAARRIERALDSLDGLRPGTLTVTSEQRLAVLSVLAGDLAALAQGVGTILAEIADGGAGR